MAKFRPLPEPIRLQDPLNSARSRTEKKISDSIVTSSPGLEITAGQRTMSGLIVDLTGQTFVLPVMLTGQNSIALKMK